VSLREAGIGCLGLEIESGRVFSPQIFINKPGWEMVRINSLSATTSVPVKSDFLIYIILQVLSACLSCQEVSAFPFSSTTCSN
jgi:hypothetical protein